MKVQASVSELTEPPTVRLSLVHPKHLAICGSFEEPPAILVSFVYYGPFKKNRAGLQFRDWMMDSGAHSAFRSGKKIDLGEYIELCLELQRTDPQLAEIITLDVIGGDWEQGLRNAREMWRRGVRAMHTYHFGEPVRVLEEALEHGKICIGGAANVHGRAKFEQARRIFDRAWPAPVRLAGVLVGIRICRHVELDLQRSSLQSEDLAKVMLQIAPIRLGDLVQRIAMNHDQGRIAAALVRIAQLWTEQTTARWRLAGDGVDQCPRQPGSRQIGSRRQVGGVDRTEERFQALSLERRDIV